MKNESVEWITFSDILIRVSSIDYFEVKDDALICNYHLGMDYRIMLERYMLAEDLLSRFEEIKKQLGIIE